MKIVIGIDPDSDKHGVAIYHDDKLVKLEMLSLMGLIQEVMYIPTRTAGGEAITLRFAIEDVCANTFVYSRNVKSNPKIQSTVARSIGACQQSQRELTRLLEFFNIPYSLYKPTKGNWSKNKSKFQLVTGWSSRSNEDTRSAAYFGFLESMKNNNLKSTKR